MQRMAVTLTEILAALTGVVLVGERQAEACGGTFCDTGAQAMPVDQKGENILFVMDAQDVEAHIQIQYDGAAKRFAWVVPVPTVPEISVGSQQLFDALLSSTVPVYGAIKEHDCPDITGTGTFTGSSGSTTTTTTGTGCATVDLHETVGAFDVTVLHGGTGAEVYDWLTTNGYATTAGTSGRLQPYVDKSYVFVAVKLNGVATVDEIHPLVVKYPGSMPCVPLILTAEAALDDMGVRAFFLSHERVYPENYASVTVNNARIDWVLEGRNYAQVVTRAVDEAPHHHGFVTEYSGSSDVVNEHRVYNPLWDAMPFETIAPEDVVTELEAQHLVECTTTCQYDHPLILGLLEQYLPPQNGLSEDDWYANLTMHAADIDLSKSRSRPTSTRGSSSRACTRSPSSVPSPR